MRPRLIHPVTVEIERVQKDQVVWDDTFREPVSGDDVPYGEPEAIEAQVRFNTYERRDMTLAGETPMTTGHILYRRGEIPSLKKGDRIKSVDGMPITSVYIVSVQPAAAGRGRFHLECAHFEERKQG